MWGNGFKIDLELGSKIMLLSKIFKKCNKRLIIKLLHYFAMSLMIQPYPQQQPTDTLQTQSKISNPQRQQKPIKRIQKHEAIMKLKQMDEHVEIMKKRYKYLQVKDEENRSRTIQHEKKIIIYEQRRDQMKKDRLEREKFDRLKKQQVQIAKEKSRTFKEEKQKKIASSLDKYYSDKVEHYQTIKQEKKKNDIEIEKFKEQYLKQKQQLRKNVNEKEQASKLNISRFKQNRMKETIEDKSVQLEGILLLASKKQKELEKLSKLEVQMVQKNSQSIQASQVMRNKLREVLGDERRYTKLPSIKSKSLTTRSSTGQTQQLLYL